MLDPTGGPPVNICILAAGAAGMYAEAACATTRWRPRSRGCGTRYARAALHAAEDRADSVAEDEVFFGGVNVYLQHVWSIFRKTPGAIDWLLDRPWLLKAAGSYGAKTPPEQLAGLSLSLLQGDPGPAVKSSPAAASPEGRRQARRRHAPQPHVPRHGPRHPRGAGRSRRLRAHRRRHLPRRDGRARPGEIQGVIRERAKDVTRFVATCDYYAARMADYCDVSRDKIDVVYPGIPADYVRHRPASRRWAAADDRVYGADLP
jgi:hypothetical protein